MNTLIKGLILIGFLLGAEIALVAQQVGFIQIADNIADPTLDTVDLYINGSVYDSNVVYHSASGFFEYRVDTAFTIGLVYKHSNGNQYDTIRTFTFPAGTLVANQRKEFVLSGVSSGAVFASNPDGLSTTPSIQIINNIDSIAFFSGSTLQDTALVTIRFFNGATDLTAVKIIYRNGAALFTSPASIPYGSGTNDVSIHPQAYEFQVLSVDGTQNFGTFSADLTNFGGQSIIIFLSGFLNPAANDSGPALNMLALLTDGAAYSLPIEYAGFQFIHNCADPAADSLDVYVNGNLAFASLGFRNCTPALLLNAYATYDVGLAHKNSTSVADTFWHHSFFFPRDTFFIATASGLLSQTGFAPNPNGISTAFNVLIKSPAEFAASSLSDFDFYMLNGVTDAPPLNLIPSGGPAFVNVLAYAEQSNYVSLPSEFFVLNVQDTSGNQLLNGFANFLAFNAESAVLLTSGFLNPAANNNGAAMGLFLAPTTGGQFVPLYSVTGIRNLAVSSEFKVYPNPANGQLNIHFSLQKPQAVSVKISDMNGGAVQTIIENSVLSGTNNLKVDLNSLPQGMYLVCATTAEGTNNYKFAITR